MTDAARTPSNIDPSLTYDDAPAAIEWHFARARKAGAAILQDLKDEEYGSRGYMAKDPEGNHWYFGTYRPGAHWGDAPKARGAG